MFGVDSKASDGSTFTTRHGTLGIGARWRVPFGESALGVVVGYGRHTFEIEDSSTTPSGVPGVAYSFLRTGVDARLRLSDSLALSPALAYLFLLDAGDLAGDDWFPHASGGGFEAALLVGFGLTDWLEIEAGVFSRRFFLTFSPEPTDAAVTTFGRVAGGAVDQQLGLRAGLALTL